MNNRPEDEKVEGELSEGEIIEVLRRRIDYLERENTLLRFELRQREVQVYGSNH